VRRAQTNRQSHGFLRALFPRLLKEGERIGEFLFGMETEPPLRHSHHPTLRAHGSDHGQIALFRMEQSGLALFC